MIRLASSRIQSSEQPVQGVDTGVLRDLLARARWDDIRQFLCIVEAGSLRGGAGSCGVTVNTARNRLDRLEAALASPLVRRSSSGVTPTALGGQLVAIAREMRSTSVLTEPTVERDVLLRPGELRIGSSEAIGSLWLTPRLKELQRRIPHLTISLQCDFDQARDRSGEVDIGICFKPPPRPGLVVSKLGRLHFMLFASTDYLRERGMPKSIDDFPHHQFIEQVAPGLNNSIIDHIIGAERPAGFIPIRTNSSIALFWAIANGAGIGAVPTYFRLISRKLVPLELPVQLRFEMYYYYHPASRRSVAVTAAVDWLKEAFDPVAYPCFGDPFIHPDMFGATRRDGAVIPLFESMLDDTLRY